MDSTRAGAVRSAGHDVSTDRRIRLDELRKKARLELREAAEYLSLCGRRTSERTLRNRCHLSEKNEDPGFAPRRIKDRLSRRIYFLVEDLDAWRRSNEVVIEGHYK
jgi:hypothetical protein